MVVVLGVLPLKWEPRGILTTLSPPGDLLCLRRESQGVDQRPSGRPRPCVMTGEGERRRGTLLTSVQTRKPFLAEG